MTIMLGMGISFGLMAFGIPTYYACTFTALLSALLLMSLGPAFRPMALGSLLIALSWVVNGYFKARGMNTYVFYDELLRIPGYFLFFPSIGKLEWKRTPKRSLWLIATILLVSMVDIVWFSALSQAIPLDALLYLITFLAMFCVSAHRIEALLWGEALFERFFWVLGLALLWVGVLLKVPDELGLASLRQHSDAVSVLGYLFVGVGLLAEEKLLPLGLWPFTAGMGGLILAWSFGLIGLKGTGATVYGGWVLIGGLVVFLSTLVLLLGYKEKLARSERRLHGWVQLLEDLLHLPLGIPEPVEGLKRVFEELKGLLEDLVGLEFDTTPPTRLGKTTPYSRLLVHKGQVLGRAFFGSKASAFELEPLLPILASRLRVLLRQFHLKIEALTDPATGLWNRRGFFQAIEDRLYGDHRASKGFSIAFLDVDDLKRANDFLGHRTGDDLIVFFANALKQFTRQEDILARWGGDEFLVVFMDTDAKSSLDILGRIEENLKKPGNLPFAWTPSFSGGVVWVPITSALPLEPWIQKADEALYVAKKQGKGRIVS